MITVLCLKKKTQAPYNEARAPSKGSPRNNTN